MAKIYTKTGDTGETSLFSGERTPKNNPRIQAYGTVDELNAVLGLLLCETLPSDLKTSLVRIQHELFHVGSDLATPTDATAASATWLKRVPLAWVTHLEEEIDSAERKLPPLSSFILPGGTRGASLLHLARTVCRRAERLMIDPTLQAGTNPVVLQYMNRLSDWLFVMSRLANHHQSTPDVIWEKQI